MELLVIVIVLMFLAGMFVLSAFIGMIFICLVIAVLLDTSEDYEKYDLEEFGA